MSTMLTARESFFENTPYAIPGMVYIIYAKTHLCQYYRDYKTYLSFVCCSTNNKNAWN